jgi:serpin B
MKSFNKFPPIVVAILLLLSACLPSASVKVARSDLPREEKPDVPQSDLSTLVDGNNTFALNLYQSLISQDGNIVFSPYSISLALAMTYAGAVGETEKQMSEVLHYKLSQDRLHPAFNQLDLELTLEGKAGSKNGQPLQIDIANALWAEKTFIFLQKYLDLIAENYGAGIQLADFVNQPETVRADINQWVSDQTHKKILDLIPAGAIDPTIKLVLVNAIYFNADWERQFDPMNTKDVPFHLLDGSTIPVKMMVNDSLDVPYSMGNGYQALELKYSGGTAVMDILVPDSGNFDVFESQLNMQNLDDTLNSLQPASLSLGLPKFSFDTSFDLGKTLSELGMSNAFDPSLADFSGLTGEHDLFISKVLHQALVKVDEKGTEAAAATSVIMAPTSIMQSNKILMIDRPFIFLIRDTTSKQVLFMGRVLNPVK